MLKGIEEVCIIDSIVVDKEHFLKAYKISPESGKLFMYNDFFKKKEEVEATVYETELGTKIYYGERQPDGKLSILSCNKMQGEWGKGSLLPGSINDSINANYPYVLTDGATIYYAADGENSMGGYDIFVTRYNTNTNTYLAPENVGMPFNSPYNDYMFVIDEFNNLGWFASDRYQPKGKVCIYIFVPNSSKRVYNYEGMDPKKAVRLAQIHSLKESWTDTNVVSDAKHRLQAIANEKPQAERTNDLNLSSTTKSHTTNGTTSNRPRPKNCSASTANWKRATGSSITNWKNNVRGTRAPKMWTERNWLLPYSTWKSRCSNCQKKWNVPPLKHGTRK